MKHYSTDYHDYVFKNGKFVGKFEEMYKYSKYIPWHEDETAYKIFSEMDLTILGQHKYKSICDIGCGLGYFTDRLYKELGLGAEKPKLTGIDISETALKKAMDMFPGIRFIKADLINERPLPGEVFDLVVVKHGLWYVCHRLKDFLKNVSAMVNRDGFLYISQSFPAGDKWVGRDVIDSPETLKGILSQYAEPVYHCIEWDWNYNGRPYVHFLGRVLQKRKRKPCG